MNGYRVSEDISMRLLNELEKEPVVTQRALADRLDIALGLVNLCLKRFYKKGYIKVASLQKNRVKYLITPKGISEKARLTYSYMNRSINYLKELRQRIEGIYAVMINSGIKNIILWGDGEIAELCYISTRGFSINIVGVVADKRIDNGFFGRHVYSRNDLKSIDYDAVLVLSIEDMTVLAASQLGINKERIYFL